MIESNQIQERKQAMKNYSLALQLQHEIQLKVIANPKELLSFDDIAQYLKAVSQEREAEERIYRLFAKGDEKKAS